MKDLTKGNPIHLMMYFAIPVFFGNVLQLVYSLTDTRIVGSLLGKEALAAVGSTSSMSNLIVGFLFGLTNGFAILVARKFGQKNEEELRQAVAGTLLLGVGTAILLTGIVLVCLKPMLHALNTPEELFEDAYGYIRIIFLGMTGSMLYNVCASVLRAIGDTITPLVFLIISTAANVVLDLLLIGPFGMGVEGAAYATIVSQSLSAGLCLVYIYVKYPMLRLNRTDFRIHRTLVWRLYQSGLSMGLMNSLVSLGTVALQSSINTFGMDTIVAHTAARKITELYMLVFSVFGTTMATYSSQNMGAGNTKRIKQGLHTVMLITWSWSAITIVITHFFAPSLVYAITKVNTPDVIATASLYLKINCVFYFVPAVITVFRNTMQGIGDHVTPILSSLIELVGKVIIVLALTPKIHYYGIIISEPIVWFLMVIPLIVQLYRNPVMKRQEGNEA